jgi:predicted flavoprotein YhiN
MKMICIDCQAQANASATRLPPLPVNEQQKTTASIIKQERTKPDSVSIDSVPAITQEQLKDNTRGGRRKRQYKKMLTGLHVTNKWVKKMNQNFWEWVESNTMTHNEVLESLRPKARPRRKNLQNSKETAATASADGDLLAKAIADEKWTRNITNGTG